MLLLCMPCRTSKKRSVVCCRISIKRVVAKPIMYGVNIVLPIVRLLFAYFSQGEPAQLIKVVCLFKKWFLCRVVILWSSKTVHASISFCLVDTERRNMMACKYFDCSARTQAGCSITEARKTFRTAYGLPISDTIKKIDFPEPPI